MLYHIVATDLNGVIGGDNKLLWHLPEDLKHFKKVTDGKAVIMGRKTHESIGKRLPNRLNIIITRDKSYKASGCIVVHSLEDAIEVAGDGDVFIIGGGEIYEQSMHLVDGIYRTMVSGKYEGDTVYPKIPSRLRMNAMTSHEGFHILIYS